MVGFSEQKCSYLKPAFVPLTVEGMDGYYCWGGIGSVLSPACLDICRWGREGEGSVRRLLSIYRKT